MKETHRFLHVLCPSWGSSWLFPKVLQHELRNLQSTQKWDYTLWRSGLVLHRNEIIFAVWQNNKFCSFNGTSVFGKGKKKNPFKILIWLPITLQDVWVNRPQVMSQMKGFVHKSTALNLTRGRKRGSLARYHARNVLMVLHMWRYV